MARNLLRLNRLAICVAAVVAALSGTALAQDADDVRPSLLLMGTVPIYWGEADELSDLVRGGASGHWARAVLEQNFLLQPLDTLTSDQLGRHRFMLMAQPRTLSAAENIALNGWVRAGGHLLLLADPMMTGESRFSIGDRRRPQDVALLSPILRHWGLELEFDDSQVPGVILADAGGIALPVNLPGQLVALDGGACDVLAGGISARCTLGRGAALVIADAALLDHAGPYAGAVAGLTALIDSIFTANGEIAGELVPLDPPEAENSARSDHSLHLQGANLASHSP